METITEYLQKAKYYLGAGDHMVGNTYALIQEPKILLTSIEHTFLCVTNALTALLLFDRSFKRIPPFHKTFESKFNIFVLKSKDIHNFTEEDVTFIKELQHLLTFHKESSVEFSRDKHLVMCSDGYDIERITPQRIKTHIQKARNFLQKIEGIINDV